MSIELCQNFATEQGTDILMKDLSNKMPSFCFKLIYILDFVRKIPCGRQRFLKKKFAYLTGLSFISGNVKAL